MRESAERQTAEWHCSDLHWQIWYIMLASFSFCDRQEYKTEVSEPSQTYHWSYRPRSTENTKAYNFGSLSFDFRITREKKTNKRIICIPQLQLLLHQPQCWGQVGRINFTTCYKAHTPAKRLHSETMGSKSYPLWAKNGKKAALLLVSDIQRSINCQVHSHYFIINLQAPDTFLSWAKGGSSLDFELPQ